MADWRPIKTAPEHEDFLARNSSDPTHPVVCRFLAPTDCGYKGALPHVSWDHSLFENADEWHPLPPTK